MRIEVVKIFLLTVGRIHAHCCLMNCFVGEQVIDHSNEKAVAGGGSSPMKRSEINALSNRLPFPVDVNELMTPKQVVVRLYLLRSNFSVIELSSVDV